MTHHERPPMRRPNGPTPRVLRTAALNLRLLPEIHRWIKACARSRKVTMTALVEWCVVEKLGRPR